MAENTVETLSLLKRLLAFAESERVKPRVRGIDSQTELLELAKQTGRLEMINAIAEFVERENG